MHEADRARIRQPAPADASVICRLRSFVAAHADDPLARITIPYLASHVSAGIGAAPLSSGGAAAVSGLRLLETAKARTGLRSPFLVSGDVIAAASTGNQRRSLAPLWEGLGGIPRRARARPRWQALWRASSRAIALADELFTLIATERTGPGTERTELAHAFLFGAAMYSLAATHLSVMRPRVALITSSHGLATRALALLAREAGIPSVYLPHAPVIRAAELADLPVDYATVRGPAEIAHYEGFGVDPNRLTAAGDPSLEAPAAPAPLDPDMPCVFAPSPISASWLRVLIERIAEATAEPIVVSPHPRQRPAELRKVCPAHWVVADGRTYDRLRAGHPVLLQHSSGVALESLQLGIPAIELTLPEHPTHYPFIAEPHIPHASTAERLADALALCRAASTDPEKRTRLRDWADQWVVATGKEAADRIHDLIARARRDGARESAIWDAWVPGIGHEPIDGKAT